MTFFCIYCYSEIRYFDSNLLFRSGRNLSSTFQPFAHVCGSLVILINILTATHTQYIHTHTFALVDRHSLLSTKYLNTASDRKSKMYAKCMSSSNRGEP